MTNTIADTNYSFFNSEDKTPNEIIKHILGYVDQETLEKNSVLNKRIAPIIKELILLKQIDQAFSGDWPQVLANWVQVPGKIPPIARFMLKNYRDYPVAVNIGITHLLKRSQQLPNTCAQVAVIENILNTIFKGKLAENQEKDALIEHIFSHPDCPNAMKQKIIYTLKSTGNFSILPTSKDPVIEGKCIQKEEHTWYRFSVRETKEIVFSFSQTFAPGELVAVLHQGNFVIGHEGIWLGRVEDQYDPAKDKEIPVALNFSKPYKINIFRHSVPRECLGKISIHSKIHTSGILDNK